jgi:mannose-6-phosphate isomerase
METLGPWFPDAVPPPGKKLGEAWFRTDPPLPILVKFLFAAENLSVQVHPTGDWGVGKTEMWRILRAVPGARIALGFERAAGVEELRAAALSGEIESLLRWIPVHAGETYFIPAGTVHAIGAGVTVCEIQQNSDITYRLYDYGRPRELHLDQGLKAADLDNWRHPGACGEISLPGGWRRQIACSYFAAEEFESDTTLRYEPVSAPYEFLICLDGAGTLDGENFHAGAVWLLSGATPPIEITAGPRLRLLRAYAPSA